MNGEVVEHNFKSRWCVVGVYGFVYSGTRYAIYVGETAWVLEKLFDGNAKVQGNISVISYWKHGWRLKWQLKVVCVVYFLPGAVFLLPTDQSCFTLRELAEVEVGCCSRRSAWWGSMSKLDWSLISSTVLKNSCLLWKEKLRQNSLQIKLIWTYISLLIKDWTKCMWRSGPCGK